MYENINENPRYLELFNNFSQWVEEELSHESDELYHEEDTPDLFTFYSELAAFRSEYKKASKRSSDYFAQSSDMFAEFHETLKNFSASIKGKHKNLLPLVDLYTRFERICEKMAIPPKKGVFGTTARWETERQTLLEGTLLLKEHFNALLSKESIQRIRTVGEKFDPTSMTAVALEYNTTHPEEFVSEEISAGFMHKNQVLQLAQVKVTTQKEQ